MIELQLDPTICWFGR